jgi:glycosyltransferase involved in cell wall biosynthesis
MAAKTGALCMTRIGINPARGEFSLYKPARVSVCLITYIPEESGYFEHRLNVLKLVFASIQKHTTRPYDLIVFDNASCPTVTQYLQSLRESGLVDYLILSRQNIGKIGALRILFQAAPGEIIAYCDDDIFFYPGWLEAHLQILENFPQAGMVSGVPVRDAARHANQSLEVFSLQPESGIRVTYERYIPDEWEIDWAVSTGRDPQAHLTATAKDQDMLIRLEDHQGKTSCEAIGSANHFQFAGWKTRLLQALPDQWSGKLMGAMIELDEAIDQAGHLRLSTSQRYVRHIGNTINPEMIKLAQSYNLIPTSEQSNLPASISTNLGSIRKRPWLFRIPGSRRTLSWIYHRLFKLLYG